MAAATPNWMIASMPDTAFERKAAADDAMATANSSAANTAVSPSG